jgi:cytidylate kinase
MVILTNKLIIAVDGYSSCGKSSFAKLIAQYLSYLYLDSGAMYRTVALFAIRNHLIKEFRIDIPALVRQLSHIHISFKTIDGEYYTFLNGENIEMEIRGVEVSSVVSEISKIPEVRAHLVQLQQAMGKDKGIVMDGRDIGTVVFPDAEIKIFMKADTAVRARRRYEELKAKGIEASLEEIRKNINERDYLDMNRKVSPLAQASDAVVLDNSNMSFEQQMEWFRKLLVERGYLSD